MAEEVDPAQDTCLQLPQAFSHVGLVTAAYAIAERTDRTAASQHQPMTP